MKTTIATARWTYIGGPYVIHHFMENCRAYISGIAQPLPELRHFIKILLLLNAFIDRINYAKMTIKNFSCSDKCKF